MIVPRIVIFIFAGRRANMEVQRPYLDRLLTEWSDAELHLWDLTRTPEDQRYLSTLHGAHDGRVRVLSHLHPGHPLRCNYPSGRRPRGHPACTCMNHKPPYEKPYKWYASLEYNDTVFVKMDDDVLFLETDRFADLIEPLAEHPNRIISANVINNAVCAKYQWDSDRTANLFALGNPADPRNDVRWWALHTDPLFAQHAHERFLTEGVPLIEAARTQSSHGTYVRTRPGEAVSINCIAFTHQTMKRLAASFAHEPRLGDEGAVDRMLPWICLNFHAAHLTFGPQDKKLEQLGLLDHYRQQYTELADRYLA